MQTLISLLHFSTLFFIHIRAKSPFCCEVLRSLPSSCCLLRVWGWTDVCKGFLKAGWTVKWCRRCHGEITRKQMFGWCYWMVDFCTPPPLFLIYKIDVIGRKEWLNIKAEPEGKKLMQFHISWKLSSLVRRNYVYVPCNEWWWVIIGRQSLGLSKGPSRPTHQSTRWTPAML